MPLARSLSRSALYSYQYPRACHRNVLTRPFLFAGRLRLAFVNVGHCHRRLEQQQRHQRRHLAPRARIRARDRRCRRRLRRRARRMSSFSPLMIPDSEPDSYFRVVVVAVAGTRVAARTPSTIVCDVVCFSSRVLAPLRHTPCARSHSRRYWSLVLAHGRYDDAA